MEKRILHIDVNNAFLSWEALERLKEGEKVDLREIPSIIGGDESKKRGVERFSIDECFLDMTDFIKSDEDIIKIGIEIKEKYGYKIIKKGAEINNQNDD